MRNDRLGRDFDKHFDNFDKKFDRTFTIASILSVALTLAFIALLGTCIYLAIKTWG
jgi:hypothetical protein